MARLHPWLAWFLRRPPFASPRASSPPTPLSTQTRNAQIALSCRPTTCAPLSLPILLPRAAISARSATSWSDSSELAPAAAPKRNFTRSQHCLSCAYSAHAPALKRSVSVVNCGLCQFISHLPGRVPCQRPGRPKSRNHIARSTCPPSPWHSALLQTASACCDRP